MSPVIRRICGPRRSTVSYYAQLINYCFFIHSFDLAETIHAQLIKVGFNSSTFLGNRCLDLYFNGDFVGDSLKVFDDILHKNTVSWNICLKGLLKFGHLERSCRLFDEMPERDVVSWNSMASGYASYGMMQSSLATFREMLNSGHRPSVFTFSILASSVFCDHQGKEIHGSIIRNGLENFNTVLGNSLINMYGKMGHINYAFSVFVSMKEVDIVSWNSLISGCYKSGCQELAINQFFMMRLKGYLPDGFTLSTVMTVCGSLQNFVVGRQVISLSVKVGLLSNPIVSSACIEFYSGCNRLEDSIKLFKEVEKWDSALYNSILAAYARHGWWEDVWKLLLSILRDDYEPTGFTLSTVLSSISFLLVDRGCQVHSLVVKLGFESDTVVGTSLVEMYTKLGLVDHAVKVFSDMEVKDLVSWNAMIMGLARNGRVFDTWNVFNKLISEGPLPDRVTFAGVLLACKYGSLLNEGMSVFQSMVYKYAVTPSEEHYVCIVDLLCEAGKVEQALNIMEKMSFQPSSSVLEPLLFAAVVHGNLNIVEKVAKEMLKLEPRLRLPYLVLNRVYEMKKRWDSMVQLSKTMKERVLGNDIGRSWLGIKDCIVEFKGDRLLNHGEKEIYLLWELFASDIEDVHHINEDELCIMWN